MKYIYLTPRVFIILMASFYLIANTILYIMRTISSDWWVGDYAVYADTSESVNTFAFLTFLAYFIVFFILCLILYKKNKIKMIRWNTGIIFYFIILLFIFQIFSALYFDAGKASSTGVTSNFLLYLLFIFSFDAFYYVYAVIERNRIKLIVVTTLFIVSNIVRGWAGFVIPLLLIYLIRKGRFKISSLLIISFTGVLLVPVLLTLRAYYRGGTGPDMSDISVGSSLNVAEYIVFSLKLLISRFDLYSHYIGVSWISDSKSLASLCMPFQESIFYKPIQNIFLDNKCISLGSYLPSFLYDFFIGKGTSFSIGSSFFALPLDFMIIYSLSYLLTILLTFLVSRWVIRSDEMTIVLLFLVTFLLFQGWMYQFIYNFLGFLICGFCFMMTIKNPKSLI